MTTDSDTPMKPAGDQAARASLLGLDDACLEVVFGELRLLDIFHLRLTCKALNELMPTLAVYKINATRAFDPRTISLPLPVKVVDDLYYRMERAQIIAAETADASKTKQGKAKKPSIPATQADKEAELYGTTVHMLTSLFKPSSVGRKKFQLKDEYHPHFSRLTWPRITSLILISANIKQLRLDGTVIEAAEAANLVKRTSEDLRNLALLSFRFCPKVETRKIQDVIDKWSSSSGKKGKVKCPLRALYVLGVKDVPLVEPIGNGTYHGTDMAVNVELMGSGLEYDYNDVWREHLYNFTMSLERLPTTHGGKIFLDASRCMDGAFCKTGLCMRPELADRLLHEPAQVCDEHLDGGLLPVKAALCRNCAEARTCGTCMAPICYICYTQRQREQHEWRISPSADRPAQMPLTLHECDAVRRSAAKGKAKVKSPKSKSKSKGKNKGKSKAAQADGDKDEPEPEPEPEGVLHAEPSPGETLLCMIRELIRCDWLE